MKFPDFIIIGAMKCGTTVLWHNLNKHPDINMGKNHEDLKKASTEIRFWNNGQPYRTWEKGVDWYKALFDGKICGEKCANYIEQYSTMERLSKHIPDVKLILCVRNPVVRAYSEYNMQKKNIKEPFSFMLSHDRGYLYRSSYYQHIVDHVFPFFPRENLHVVIQERMKTDTNKIVNDIYKFLGVDTYDLDVVPTTQKVAADRNLNLNKDKTIKEYKVWASLYKTIDEVLTEKQRRELFAYFKPLNDKLFDFLGYGIEEWDVNYK